jgi:hypothetical protein
LLALECQIFSFGKVPHKKSENKKANYEFYPVRKEGPGKNIAE